jgi:hypothetical protein
MRSQEEEPRLQTVKYHGRSDLLPVTGTAFYHRGIDYSAFSLNDSINKDKTGTFSIKRNMGYGGKSKRIFQ